MIETCNVSAQVIIKQQDAAEAAFERHNAQLAKVNAWSRQVNTLKHDMTKGIKHVGCLVRVGQTPETSAEMRATIDAINALGVKFKEVRMYRSRTAGHPSLIKDATMIWDVPGQEGLLPGAEHYLNPL